MQNDHIDNYFGSAFVRGSVLQGKSVELPESLLETSLDELTEQQRDEIVEIGRKAGLSLHRFKLSLGNLPRVRRVFGFLQGVIPESILDVGSGRGAFLWPFMRTFPGLPVTAIDLDEHHFETYEAVRLGGIDTLTGHQADIRTFNAPDKSFDIVTMLEVLEHIPDPAKPIENAVRLAQRHVVISVPSKEDDNPHHLHLLTEPILRDMLANAGCTRVRFDYTLGHLLAIVTL